MTHNYDPDGEIETSEKSIFEIQIPNFCYIQVIVFDLSYLPAIFNFTVRILPHFGELEGWTSREKNLEVLGF